MIEVADRKLLLLAPSAGFGGGIERVAESIERAWPARCLRVNLYRRAREKEAAGNRLRQAQFGAQVVVAALRQKPDLIFCLHAGLLPIAIAAAQASGGKLALWAHGDEVWLAPPRHRLQLWRHIDVVFASSTFTSARVLDTTPVDPSRVNAMHLPVAPLFENVQLSAQHVAERQILSVGRISRQSRYKGYYEIADCFPLVRDEVPDASWQLVGGGDDAESLLAYCRRMGLDEHSVRLASDLSDQDLTTAYHRATALVLPSVVSISQRSAAGEGFGLVYAEAGMFGVPSIASTEGGGALDFVENGKTGLTVRPGDRAGLASAITQLLTNPSYRDKLGKEARERALDKHTFATFESELHEIVAEVKPLRKQ